MTNEDLNVYMSLFEELKLHTNRQRLYMHCPYEGALRRQLYPKLPSPIPADVASVGRQCSAPHRDVPPFSSATKRSALLLLTRLLITPHPREIACGRASTGECPRRS